MSLFQKKPIFLRKENYSLAQAKNIFLKKRIEQEGVSFLQKPLRIDADGGIEFQKAIDTLDICTLIGFKTVSIKLKQ